MLNLTSDAVWKLRDYFHILSSEIMTEIQKEAPGVVVVVVVAAFFFVCLRFQVRKEEDYRKMDNLLKNWDVRP